jgi:hypothetical protein
VLVPVSPVSLLPDDAAVVPVEVVPVLPDVPLVEPEVLADVVALVLPAVPVLPSVPESSLPPEQAVSAAQTPRTRRFRMIRRPLGGVGAHSFAHERGKSRQRGTADAIA